MKRVVIHTDGACKGNPGPGAYAAVLVFGKHRKEVSGGYRLTTNNRMEIMAAVAALSILREPCEVDLYSDSKYLIRAITEKWIQGWQRRNWKKADNQAVKNTDLWQQLVTAIEPHRIHWHWVKGHAGNRENERCDELANLAVTSPNLPEDTGFSGADD